jgi:hypothetical protein
MLMKLHIDLSSLIAVSVIALLVMGVGIAQSNSQNTVATPVTTSTGTMAATPAAVTVESWMISGNKTIELGKQIITFISVEFSGPTYTNSSEGLRLEAAFSNSSVNIGETLWIRVNLTGPDAWNADLARFTVTNSNGEKVYDICMWLPHRTLAIGENPPQEYAFTLEWEAKMNPSLNIEVTPGSYSFILTVESVNIRGTMEVK